jgi:hypothetical protein
MTTIMIAVKGEKPEENGRQDDDEHDVEGQRDAIGQVAVDAPEDAPRLVDGAIDHRQAGSRENQRRGAPRSIGGPRNGRAAVGLFQCRCIIDPVAGHRHQVARATARP